MASLREKFSRARSSEVVKLPYLVLATLILLTIGTTYLFYQSARGKDAARFSSEVQRIQMALDTRLSLYVALLKSGRGFIESNPNLTRREFANFVNNLELSKHYAGVQGIGYTRIVTPEGRDALVERMRAEGFPDFRIFPDAESDFRTSIIYLEPFDDRNRQAIGFDMASEASRREAMERARDAGEAAASARVTLLQEVGENVQSGFLIYLPIYSNGAAPSTLEEKRQSLQGFVYSPFRAGNFLSEIQDITDTGDIEVKIYDGELTPQNLLAQSPVAENEAAPPPINEDFSAINKLDVGGRDWTVIYETNPAFHQQSSIGWTPVIFLSGMAFSFLLFGMTYWESSARAKIQTIAGELLDSEQQKRKLLVKEQEARMAAESANMAKDEFISVVSHELRTPLNAIAGWTTILKTNHLTEEKRKFALGKIEKSLRLQADLVDDLLNYSQMMTEHPEIEEKPFVFSDALEEVVEKVESRAKDKGVELLKENHLNGSEVLGDEEKIKTVLANLLSNAIKFTPEGGKVEVEAKTQGENITIVVKDTGVGISSRFLPHIFERFRQADSSTTRRHGGLGLGLAISKQIVKLHKGTIEAHSEGEGKGSIFVVKLPVKEKRERQEKRES